MTSKARGSQKRRTALAAEIDSHVGDACPYLGLYADPRTHYAFPSRANCCHTHEPALLIDLDYQSAYCLSDRWPTCPLYQTARSKGVRRSRLRDGRGWLVVAGMVTAVAVLAVLLLRLWLGGALSAPAPAPTAPATGSAPLAAGGGTPPPSPSSAPTATASRRPQNPGQTAVVALPAASQEPIATGAPSETPTPTSLPATLTRTATSPPPTSTSTPTQPPTSTPTPTPPPPTPTSIPTPSPPTPTSTSTPPPPTPTSTPTGPPPSPTPTDTSAPPTSTPTATAPPTPPPPTATATVTPTQVAITYPAPVLVAPADGQSFGPNDTVTLVWTSVGALDAAAFYAIMVEYGHLNETWYDATPRVRDTRWTLSEHRYLLDLASDGRFRWWVQVMRQTGVDASGNPTVVAASPPSAVRVVIWRGESAPPPVDTPAPPPA